MRRCSCRGSGAGEARARAVEDRFDFGGAMRVGVLAKDATAGGGADASRARAVAAFDDRRHLVTRARDQDFALRLEEQLDAGEVVADNAGARAGGFEHARGRRAAVARHRIAVDVEDQRRSAVERVVIARVDVANIAYICWPRLVVPAVAAEEKAAFAAR